MFCFVELPVEEGTLSFCCCRDVFKLLGGSIWLLQMGWR